MRAALCVQAEDAVADGERADGCAHRRHLAGELAAEDLPPWSEETRIEPRDEKLGAPKSGICAIDRRRVDPDQYLFARNDGPRNVLESQDVRRSIGRGRRLSW